MSFSSDNGYLIVKSPGLDFKILSNCQIAKVFTSLEFVNTSQDPDNYQFELEGFEITAKNAIYPDELER